MSNRACWASIGIVVIMSTNNVGAAQDNKSGGASEQQKAAAGAASPGSKPAESAKATFGGGCYWCLDAVFERIPGVKSVVSGFAGGTVPHPSYEQVCTGLTGHAEVVQIEYDPAVVSYEKLLEVFWKSHDPTTLNQQGPDVGTQYRSVIFYRDEAQKEAAQKSIAKLTAADAFGAPIVTQLEPLTAFYPAEAYHQHYYAKHPNAPYCKMMIAPKLKKLHLK